MSDKLDVEAELKEWQDADFSANAEVGGSGKYMCEKYVAALTELRAAHEKIDELEVTLDDEQAAHQDTLRLLEAARQTIAEQSTQLERLRKLIYESRTHHAYTWRTCNDPESCTKCRADKELDAVAGEYKQQVGG